MVCVPGWVGVLKGFACVPGAWHAWEASCMALPQGELTSAPVLTPVLFTCRGAQCDCGPL